MSGLKTVTPLVIHKVQGRAVLKVIYCMILLFQIHGTIYNSIALVDGLRHLIRPNVIFLAQIYDEMSHGSRR